MKLKPVYIGSITYGVHPQSTLRRYSKEHKKRIQIRCPNVVKEYNKNMGGVDENNYLVSLYRLKYKSRRWYMPIVIIILTSVSPMHGLSTERNMGFEVVKVNLKGVGC